MRLLPPWLLSHRDARIEILWRPPFLRIDAPDLEEAYHRHLALNPEIVCQVGLGLIPSMLFMLLDASFLTTKQRVNRADWTITNPDQVLDTERELCECNELTEDERDTAESYAEDLTAALDVVGLISLILFFISLLLFCWTCELTRLWRYLRRRVLRCSGRYHDARSHETGSHHFIPQSRDFDPPHSEHSSQSDVDEIRKQGQLVDVFESDTTEDVTFDRFDSHSRKWGIVRNTRTMLAARLIGILVLSVHTVSARMGIEAYFGAYPGGALTVLLVWVLVAFPLPFVYLAQWMVAVFAVAWVVSTSLAGFSPYDSALGRERKYERSPIVAVTMLCVLLLLFLIVAWERNHKRKKEFLVRAKLRANNLMDMHLLLNMMPSQVLDRLLSAQSESGAVVESFIPLSKNQEVSLEDIAEDLSVFEADLEAASVFATVFKDVSVLFVNISLHDSCSSQPLVKGALLEARVLHELFTQFDELLSPSPAYKVESVGGVYVAVAGVPSSWGAANQATVLLQLVGAFHRIWKKFSAKKGRKMGRFSAGIHTGHLSAGVVGVQAYGGSFKLMGDTVNVTSRMCSQANASEVCLSSRTASLIRGPVDLPDCESVNVKGKGTMLISRLHLGHLKQFSAGLTSFSSAEVAEVQTLGGENLSSLAKFSSKQLPRIQLRWWDARFEEKELEREFLRAQNDMEFQRHPIRTICVLTLWLTVWTLPGSNPPTTVVIYWVMASLVSVLIGSLSFFYTLTWRKFLKKFMQEILLFWFIVYATLVVLLIGTDFSHWDTYHVGLIAPWLFTVSSAFVRFDYAASSIVYTYGGWMVVEFATRGESPQALIPLVTVIYLVLARGHATELRRIFLVERQFSRDAVRSNKMLREVLPSEVLPALRQNGELPEFKVHFATVVQSDLRGFTAMSSCLSPARLSALLNELYTLVDECLELHGLYKLEIVGDSVIACAGLFSEDLDEKGESGVNSLENDRAAHCEAALRFALDLAETASRVRLPRAVRHLGKLEWRVGVHSSLFVGGIIGRSRIRYHLVGAGMDIVGKLEAASPGGAVLCSRSTVDLVRSGKNDDHLLSFSRFLGDHSLEEEEAFVVAQERHGFQRAQHPVLED